MTAPEAARDKARRVVEGATWRVHLAEMGVESTPEFEDWLAEENNRAVWKQISAPWDFFQEQANDPLTVAERQSALGSAKRAHNLLQRPRRLRRAISGLAASLIVIGFAGAGLWWRERPSDYVTGIGERRVVVLPDGSKVSLDSNSEVTVRFTKTSRELQLLHGQARFDVSHDVERPFSVVARDQKVVATGTAFNIDIAGQKVFVTLIEGHVVILNEARPLHVPSAEAPQIEVSNAVELHAGQEMTALPDKPPEVQSTNIQRVTAWTNGQLVFEDETLGEVVARISRYTDTPILIDDPKTASLRISGVFNTGDIPTFVAIVTHYLPVEAERKDGSGATIILRKRKS